MDLIAHPFSPFVVVPPFTAAAIVISLAVRAKRLTESEQFVWRTRLHWVTLAFWSGGTFASAWLLTAALADSVAEAALSAALFTLAWFTISAAVALSVTRVLLRAPAAQPSYTHGGDLHYDPHGVLEPSLRGRLLMVGSVIVCYLLGLIPESISTFSGWMYTLAHVFTLVIFANFVSDGRPGVLSKMS